MINDSLRTIAETEEIGGVIINELQRNTETIKSSHNKVSFLEPWGWFMYVENSMCC